MKDMSAATNLNRRGPVYYCRRRIPQDLLRYYGGKTELSVSLRTKDEARRLASEQWQRWEAEFEARRRSNGVVLLSDEQFEAIAHEHYSCWWTRWTGSMASTALSTMPSKQASMKATASYPPRYPLETSNR